MRVYVVAVQRLPLPAGEDQAIHGREVAQVLGQGKAGEVGKRDHPRLAQLRKVEVRPIVGKHLDLLIDPDHPLEEVNVNEA